jgi:hypothetical protein
MGVIVELAKILGDEFRPKDMYPLLRDYLISVTRHLMEAVADNRRENILSSIISRIHSWEKDEKYAEHIVEPRVNWLLDLKLISKSKNRGFYHFTDNGNRLINVITGINEAYLRGWLDNSLFIEDSFFSAFDYIYQIDANKSWSYQVLVKHLNRSMEIFKTDAPRRIAASQAITYTCSMCLLEDCFIINFNQVKDFLLKKDNGDFLLDWFKTENDGSLTKQIL